MGIIIYLGALYLLMLQTIGIEDMNFYGMNLLKRYEYAQKKLPKLYTVYLLLDPLGLVLESGYPPLDYFKK